MASFDCTLHIRFEYHQFVDDLPLSLFSSPCYVGQLEGAVPSRIDVHHLTFQPTNDPRKGSLSFFLGFEHWVLPNNHIRSHQVMPWAWRKLRILHTGERTCPNISKSGELHGQTGHKKSPPRHLGFLAPLPCCPGQPERRICGSHDISGSRSTRPSPKSGWPPSACQRARWTARCRCLPSCGVHHETTRLRRSSKCRSWGAGLKTSAPWGTCQGDHLCWEQLKELNRRCRRQCWIATPPDHGLGASPLTETTAFSGMWVLPMRLCLCQKMALATYVK